MRLAALYLAERNMVTNPHVAEAPDVITCLCSSKPITRASQE